MTATHFLDTSFLIDLIDDRDDAIELHDELAGEETTGTICVYELAKVADFAPSSLFAGKEVLALSSEDAAAAGEVYRELSQEGTPIGEMDALVAGIVRNRSLTLVTRDEHFRLVDGLETRYY